MPAVFTRRSRLSYIKELDKAQAEPDQTPIERVQNDPSPSVEYLSRVTRHSWIEDSNALDNIRLTPFGHERTDYTYGDSGSYRSDRIQKTWDVPNMARLPLRQLHEQQQITTLGSRESTSTEMMELRDRRKTVISLSSSIDAHQHAAKQEPDEYEVENDEETSSRHSVNSSSTNASSRITRSRCKQVQGEWCTHAECAVNWTSRRSLSRQRNTNNTTSTTNLLGEQDRPDATPSMGRSRVSRRSSRSVTTKTVVSNAQSTGPDLTDRSQHLGASSSTYVYHYVPHVDSAVAVADLTMQPPPVSGDGPGKIGIEGDSSESSWVKRLSTAWLRPTVVDHAEVAAPMHRLRKSTNEVSNDSHPRSWFARHIFGLEKSSRSRSHTGDNSSGHYLSSDAEESESQMDEQVFTRRRVGRASLRARELTGINSHRRYRLSGLGQLGTRGLQMVRRGTIEGLALILALFYALSNLVTGVVRLFSRPVWRLFTMDSSARPSADKPIHPRLAQFREETTSGLTSTRVISEETSLASRVTHALLASLKYVMFRCCHLLGFLCFLIPLLLLMAFLFAPVAVDDGQPPPLFPPFLTDMECNRSVSDALLPGANTWAVAWWRFRCLYNHYVLSALLPESNTTEADLAGSSVFRWASLMNWWSSSPGQQSIDSDTSASPKISIDGLTESRLLEQLAQFTQVVNRRLDLLSESLRSTNDRVSTLASQSETGSKTFHTQLTDLRGQLNAHADSLKRWQLEWQSHEALTKIPQADMAGSQSPSETEQLLRSAIDSVNQTVFMQFDKLRAELLADQSDHWKQFEDRLTKMSVLLANLRFQLTYRIRQTENELAQLRLQLRNRLDKQAADRLTLSTTVNELQLAIDKLETRYLSLEKTNMEAESIVRNAHEAVRQCTERQSQLNRDCQTAAANQVEIGIAKLSEQLTAQISSLVEEALQKHVHMKTLDSVLLSRINELVTQVAREAIDKAVADKLLTDIDAGKQLVSVGDQHTIQSLIDAALQRFAADRTGMADFALESAGGSIVGTRCTKTYTEGSALFSIFGIPLARLSNSPRTILQPGNNPGDCWPFHGSSGQAVIRLSAPILITSVSLEHLPRSLAPNERLDSAPKHFLIKGLASENDEEGVVLGNFTYDIRGPPIQTFAILGQKEPRQLIEFAVLSNHGHPLYTCVYRLRVHGTLPE